MDSVDFLYFTFIPPGMLLAIKTLFILISLLFIVGIAFFLRQTGWLTLRYAQDMQDFWSFKEGFAKKFEKALKKINKRLESQSVSEHKLALIEVDNLLSEALNKMGYKGRDMEEKLTDAGESMASVEQEIKGLRKIINNIINDPDYVVSQDKAKDIVKSYEKVLQDLNVI